jgi:hypothetical protein
MTGLTWIALAAFALAATTCAAWIVRRQRNGTSTHPGSLSPVTPGARAFVSHVGTLSDFRLGLRPPPRGEGWRRLSSLGAVR